VRTSSAEFTLVVQELGTRRGSPVTAAKLFTETEDSRQRREEVKRLRTETHLDAHTGGRPTKRARRMIQKLRCESL